MARLSKADQRALELGKLAMRYEQNIEAAIEKQRGVAMEAEALLNSAILVARYGEGEKEYGGVEMLGTLLGMASTMLKQAIEGLDSKNVIGWKEEKDADD